ncbi:MAG: hypothetical protein M3680_01050 [Myxococcota bacterium]|nr:hypothetical protein [Myxococcota bacterium]
MPRDPRSVLVLLTSMLMLGPALGACTNDPLYLPGALQLTAGGDDGMGGVTVATARHTLPIKTETSLDARERGIRTAALMVDVPYVKVGDLEVSVEWSIRNLTDTPGEARVQLNGANEVIGYDPGLLAVGLDEDDPQPPGLEGDVPIRVPAGSAVTGLFREDQLREASIDLDQITRGNVNPFRATLTVSKNVVAFPELTPQTYDANGEPLPQSETGVTYPREAFRQIVRIDLVFKPDREMELSYTIRVRDVRGIMHELLDAAVEQAPGELTVFAPGTYTPAPP